MADSFLEVQTFMEYLDRLEEFHHLAYSPEVFRHESILMETEKGLSHRKKENLLKAKKAEIAQKTHGQIDELLAAAKREGEWIRNEEWPSSIPVSYRFPGGKNGDIDHFITMDCALSLSEDNSIWTAIIPTSRVECIDLLCYPLYIPFEDYGPFGNPTEAMTFLCRYNRYVKILERMSYVNYYTGEYKSLKSIADPDLRELLGNKNKEIITGRHDIYEKLLADGKSHGKWVSEEKAFAIVRRKFPDAKFHYEAEWLQGQHLDIYIPSIKAAIEYQGKQHYECIPYFGGDKGLKDNELRDEKKRQRCKANGVQLFTWDFDEPLTQHYFDRHISPFLTMAQLSGAAEAEEGEGGSDGHTDS